MFDSKYLERTHKLAKAIIDYYGHDFFYGKKILDLGSGHGDMAASLARLGATVLCCDVRQQNIDIIKQRHPYLQAQLVNLENEWPFPENSFDIVLSLGVICHLKNYESHMKNIFSAGDNIVLETEVYDASNVKRLPIYEDKSVPSLSFSGEGSALSSSFFQNQFSSFGFSFKRVDDGKLNMTNYCYDWRESNLGHRSARNRRLWFVKKEKHLIFEIEKKAKEIELEIKNKQNKIEEEAKPVKKIIAVEKSAILPEHKKYFLHVPEANINNNENNIIRLFYIYNNNIPETKKEIDFCFQKNINNKLLNIIFINEQYPEYSFIFNKINEITGPNDINIICNSNIFFDDTIGLANNIKHKELYALSTWNWNDNNVSFNGLSNSQCAWIFKGKVEDVYGDFPVDGLECDTKIAYEFNKKGYKVFNPSKSIKVNKLGENNINYKNAQKPIYGPHLFTIPTQFSNELEVL